MAVTIKGFGSDWSVPAPAQTSLNALYTAKADGVIATDVANSAFLVSGTRVALGGDSITDGSGSTNAAVDSYRAYLAKIVGGARINVAEHGVPGEPASGLLARMPAILAENPAVFVMMIGTNPSSSFTKYKTDVTSILDLTRAARIPTVVCTIPPGGAGRADAAAHTTRVNNHNLWLKHTAKQRGLPVADVFAATVDQATGYLRTAYDADNTHPTPAGHLAIALTVASVLDGVLPPATPLVTAPGAPGLIANPLMSGGSDTTPPAGWGTAATPTAGSTFSSSTVDPVEGDVLTHGKWMRLATDATALGTSSFVARHHALSPAPAAGDVLLVTAAVKADPGKQIGKLQLLAGGTTLTVLGEQFGIAEPGVLRSTFTVPAGVSGTIYLRYDVSAPAGGTNTAYLGEAQVYNLTQNSLLELV